MLHAHGAKDGTRTRCLGLGKPALDHMSFFRKWYALEESNFWESDGARLAN